MMLKGKQVNKKKKISRRFWNFYFRYNGAKKQFFPIMRKESKKENKIVYSKKGELLKLRKNFLFFLSNNKSTQIRDVYKSWLFLKSRTRLASFDTSKCFCIVKVTANNFFATGFVKNLVTKQKQVLFTISGGFIGERGPRRATPTCAKDVGHVIAYRFIKKKFFVISLILRCAVNKHVRAFVTGLKQSGVKFAGVRMDWRIAHNGCRLPTKRRV